MKMIRAIGDKVVVEELIKRQTKGGIIIPETAIKPTPQKYGRVLSFGTNVVGLKINDIVVFHPSGGMAMVIEKRILRTLMFAEVFGILDSKEEKEGLEPITINVGGQ
jgi:co-chaperonin GroES (HSP10)